MRLVGWLGTALLIAGPVSAQEIGSVAAINHAGENVTVCGVVASVNVLAKQDVVLAFDYPYPGQRFSVMITAMDRGKFNGREFAMKGHRMCSSGIVRLVEGRAQMTLKDPDRLLPQ